MTGRTVALAGGLGDPTIAIRTERRPFRCRIAWLSRREELEALLRLVRPAAAAGA